MSLDVSKDWKRRTTLAKYFPDATIDGELNLIDAADYMCLCNAQPTSYLEARSTYMLAEVALVPSDIVVAADVDGRKATVAAKTGISVSVSGSATHVALVSTSGSALRAVTTCPSQSVTAGNTVDLNTWKANAKQPV